MPASANPFIAAMRAVLARRGGAPPAAQPGAATVVAPQMRSMPTVLNDSDQVAAPTEAMRDQRRTALLHLLRANNIKGVPVVFEDGSTIIEPWRRARLPGMLT